MVASWQILDRATATRKRLLAAGFLPLPAKGKAIPVDGWTSLQATETDIDGWFNRYPDAPNTGVLTRTTPAVDLDVYDQDVAEQLEALLFDMIGTRTMVRFGQPPKRAILFRTDTPFKKIVTPTFISPCGKQNRVEVLGDGQQIIVHGIHPETGKAYSWYGGEPGDISRADLPELTEAMASEFIVRAAAVMQSAGWVIQQGAQHKPRSNGHAGAAPTGEFDAIYGDREQKFAKAALEGCAQELAAMAPNSGRNDKLNKVAFRLGTMVARNWINRDEVEARLVVVATMCQLVVDDGERACRATLASGLDAGQQSPHPDLDERKPATGGEAWREQDAVPAGDLIQSSADFVSGFVPPDYLIDGWLIRQFVYSMTGMTGHGKTTVMLLVAALAARGLSLDGRQIEKCRVLFFAGENPDDIRMRWIKLCEELGYDPADMDVFFMPGTPPISVPEIRSRIDTEATKHGPFGLLIVDTSAAYFRGDDERVL